MMHKYWVLTPFIIIIIFFPGALSYVSEMQELYEKLNRMSSIAADMFVGRGRFATLLLMRLTETVILWLSEDQSFWDDIEEGPRPLGPLGLQQVRRYGIVLCPVSAGLLGIVEVLE